MDKQVDEYLEEMLEKSDPNTDNVDDNTDTKHDSITDIYAHDDDNDEDNNKDNDKSKETNDDLTPALDETKVIAAESLLNKIHELNGVDKSIALEAHSITNDILLNDSDINTYSSVPSSINRDKVVHALESYLDRIKLTTTKAKEQVLEDIPELISDLVKNINDVVKLFSSKHKLKRSDFNRMISSFCNDKITSVYIHTDQYTDTENVVLAPISQLTYHATVSNGPISDRIKPLINTLYDIRLEHLFAYNIILYLNDKLRLEQIYKLSNVDVTISDVLTVLTIDPVYIFNLNKPTIIDGMDVVELTRYLNDIMYLKDTIYNTDGCIMNILEIVYQTQ